VVISDARRIAVRRYYMISTIVTLNSLQDLQLSKPVGGLISPIVMWETSSLFGGRKVTWRAQHSAVNQTGGKGTRIVRIYIQISVILLCSIVLPVHFSYRATFCFSPNPDAGNLQSYSRPRVASSCAQGFQARAGNTNGKLLYPYSVLFTLPSM
jgi:hypothetical protein